MTDIKAVALNEKVVFRCQLCGECCRHVSDCIMLSPMDAYRLARRLREQGEPEIGRAHV